MVQSNRFVSMFRLSVELLGLGCALAMMLGLVHSASAGAVGGRRSGSNVAIERGGTRTFYVAYYSGYSAVSVSSADIVIRVYDSSNRLVAQSNGRRAASWNTPSQGQYRIEFTYQPSDNGERTRFNWNTN